MIQGKIYVSENAEGALRVGELDISLNSVVVACQQGNSAETIQQLYPALTLEEVYGAIAVYLANQQEVEQYLKDQEVRWQDLRQAAAQSPSPVVARLRASAEAINRATP